jgi:hypothetical protein
MRLRFSTCSAATGFRAYPNIAHDRDAAGSEQVKERGEIISMERYYDDERRRNATLPACVPSGCGGAWPSAALRLLGVSPGYAVVAAPCIPPCGASNAVHARYSDRLLVTSGYKSGAIFIKRKKGGQSGPPFEMISAVFTFSGLQSQSTCGYAGAFLPSPYSGRCP